MSRFLLRNVHSHLSAGYVSNKSKPVWPNSAIKYTLFIETTMESMRVAVISCYTGLRRAEVNSTAFFIERVNHLKGEQGALKRIIQIQKHLDLNLKHSEINKKLKTYFIDNLMNIKGNNLVIRLLTVFFFISTLSTGEKAKTSSLLDCCFAWSGAGSPDTGNWTV